MEAGVNEATPDDVQEGLGFDTRTRNDSALLDLRVAAHVRDKTEWQRSGGLFVGSNDSEGEERAQELYRSRPSAEKEAYANRYASDMRQELRASEVIPFDRQLSESGLAADRLNPEWFEVGES